MKGSVLADYLAQQPISDYQPMHPEFPDEDIMAFLKRRLKMRTGMSGSCGLMVRLVH